MLKLITFCIKLVIASAATFILASALQTQAVLSGLLNIGAEIPISLRIQTIFVDLIGLFPTYGLVILLGMLIAMAVASLLISKLPSTPQTARTLVYATAGALAMLCILLAMYPILNVTMIAGARGWSGLLSQCIAGAIGGIIFANIKTVR